MKVTPIQPIYRVKRDIGRSVENGEAQRHKQRTTERPALEKVQFPATASIDLVDIIT